ncbi:hypothetical protein KY290_018077 [Solanum tuberosum]|uniref:Integrase core domain containing protein n=1 Tax=Solanum tuberosum TaxID=4113 RepID=A0ABQ7VD68_SOLTU|nr:hypothetical protein KY290_018077 [Solanum tuberosum]
MVNGNKQIADTVAAEMRVMRALMERLFGELNSRLDKSDARLEKFDEQILELKKCIESSRDQEKGEKMIEAAMNRSSDGHENSSMLQEEQVKRHREPITATYSRKRSKKKDAASLIEDDGLDVPIVDLVPTAIDVIEDNDVHVQIVDVVPTEIDRIDVNVPIVDVVPTEIERIDVNVPIVDVVPTEIDMELSVDGGFCVTGYHGEIPLAVLMGEEETTHNFINESLADMLGCETVPIQPQTVRSDLGEMVISRVCNNFQLSMEGTVFNLKVYLLPLSSKYDMVLGGEWLGTLEKVIISSAGLELYLHGGEKKFMPFKKSVRGRRPKRF